MKKKKEKTISPEEMAALRNKEVITVNEVLLLYPQFTRRTLYTVKKYVGYAKPFQGKDKKGNPRYGKNIVFKKEDMDKYLMSGYIEPSRFHFKTAA